MIYMTFVFKVHLTPNFLFAYMNVLAFLSISVKKFLDLVKSLIFCDLMNWRIIWSSTEQHGIWNECRGCHVI